MVSAVTRNEAGLLSDDLAVIAEPHRLLMLRHLRRGSRSAGYLARAVGIPQPLAAYHLSVLLGAGLVTRSKRGNFSCYAADRHRVEDLHRRIGRLVGASGAVSEGAPADDPAADGPC
jgi:ArsR family transcriptional regulator, arsenate/arsenite/antimonite-responsive transcriptional repressor